MKCRSLMRSCDRGSNCPRCRTSHRPDTRRKREDVRARAWQFLRRLVHGAARRRTSGQGFHRAFTPTNTGVGERKHLLSRDMVLDTFIIDVMNVIEDEGS